MPGLLILPIALVSALLPQDQRNRQIRVFLVLVALVLANGWFWLVRVPALSTVTNIIPASLLVTTALAAYAQLRGNAPMQGLVTGSAICLGAVQLPISVLGAVVWCG